MLHSPCRQARLPPDPKSLQLSCAALRRARKLDLKFQYPYISQGHSHMLQHKASINISMTMASQGSSFLPTRIPLPTARKSSWRGALSKALCHRQYPHPEARSDRLTPRHTCGNRAHLTRTWAPRHSPAHTQLLGVHTSCAYGRQTNCCGSTPGAGALGRPGRAPGEHVPARPARPGPARPGEQGVKGSGECERPAPGPAQLTARGSRRPSCSW